MEIRNLTEREKSVLKLLTQGLENSEIASILFISPHTVKACVSSILKKLSSKNRTQAIYVAMKNGMLM